MNLRIYALGEVIKPHISVKFFLVNLSLCCRVMVNTADLHWIISFAAARSYFGLFEEV